MARSASSASGHPRHERRERMSRASGHRAAAVALIGAGAWGTALAVHLARRGGRARLWARDPALAAEMRKTGQNARYLAGLAIPPGVEVISEPAPALAGTGIVIVAATKGLEPERGGRISCLLSELLPGHPVAVLSGPSFAREVALGLPTALVVASEDGEIARLVH